MTEKKGPIRTLGVRVFQLAKELEMTSKELMSHLHTQGHKVTSHMSTIDNHVATIIRDRLRKKVPKDKPASGPSAAPGKGGPGTAQAPAPAGLERKPPVAARPGTPDSRPAAGVPPRPAAGIPGRGAPGAVRPGAPRGPDLRAKPAGGVVPGGIPAARGELPAGERAHGRERLKEKGTEGPAEGADRPKESLTRRKRYFPTQDDLYDSGPRFGGTRRRLGPKPRTSKESEEAAGVVTAERPQRVEVGLPITVKELSSAMGLKLQAIITSLMKHGQAVNINQFLDEDQITLIGLEFNIDIAFKQKDAGLEDVVKKIEDYASEPSLLVPRAPVVTFMGHVDHGKTSLLDRIRQTKVVSQEAGGITQHLGAYRVDMDNVHVVFIDTPGHKAFTQMRARGADVTDVAVLVVAADDGVMPQTEEALNHARAAEVPIVVAINKVDKPNANPARVKQQLADLGVLPVEWNGDTEFVEVSAHTGQGIDTLLETLSLTSEILELKANPQRPGIGVVLEAEATTGQGVVATVLVQDGTLRQGDYVLCGPAQGRVRSLLLNAVTPLKEAGPSMPVRMTGLGSVPEAGDKVYVFTDAQQAREIAEERQRRKRESERAERQHVTLETLFKEIEKGTVEEVRLILKADGRGSIAALRQALESLSTDEVKVKLLHTGVGAISQDDIGLADASGAIVLGFHVSADERARRLAEERRVEIRIYDVIYQAIDEVRGAMEARLAPQRQEQVKGHAEIRQIYKASKVGNIAGCMVTSGSISRNDQVRLVRDGRVVHTGTLSSLKRFKDDAREVKEGFECGIKIANFDDIKSGDVIEAFTIVETPRAL